MTVSRRKIFNPYLQIIGRGVGTLLHIPGIMALVTIPVCLLAGETYAAWPFALTAGVAIASGQLLRYPCRNSAPSRLRHAVLTVALSWLLIPLVGALPIYLIAAHLADSATTPLTVTEFHNFWNPVFEAFSGFTSAGLTVTLHASELPYSLQWWRSLMQWVGGVGVIVLMLTVLEPSTDAYQLYSAEGRQQRIGLTLNATVRHIWWIYLVYTGGGILWLHLVGMSWWEALNHSMTGISTGGFSVADNSIGSYDLGIQLAMIPIMILGSMSFAIHYQVLRKRNWRVLWTDTQHRALWIVLVLGFLALLLELSGFRPWSDALFLWASALGTCGFTTADLQDWNATSKLLLAIGMVFGGAAGSTAGGLKMSRVSSLFKAILWRFQRLSLKPHQVMRYILEGKAIPEAEANRRIESAAVLAVLWVSLILLGIFVLRHVSLPDYTLSDVVFETASALGSAGLTTGITHPDLPWLGKLVLILFMWMGRLEIIPVLLLLSWPLGVIRQRMRRYLRSLSSR
ncbi:Trk system potassium uptake protein TrkH [Acaryochloris thomasi RCC1774]|uniref:Trk system potassium uptake protein TrkH n=1 Tax=Acaryochloris thomasi RCC1774 TaxID=1764569 RepID=A0A2W1J9K3_9CYAN|nr:TrkH family potassium uptake protein [Acaryochloris thomasi]PZD70953.1 Trk system potassium uptake protein TrkH [Acaryochloris thomasi RCC1774]